MEEEKKRVIEKLIKIYEEVITKLESNKELGRAELLKDIKETKECLIEAQKGNFKIFCDMKKKRKEE